MKEFLRFLRTGLVVKSNNRLQYLHILIILILSSFSLHFISLILNELLSYYEIIQKTENISNLFDSDKLKSWIRVAVIAPIIEELSFRYPLKDQKLSIPIFVSLFLPSLASISFLVSLTLSLCLFLLMLLLYNNWKWLRVHQSLFYKKNPLLILYLLASIFGVLHLSNYNIQTLGLLSSLIIIIPHIFSGLIFSFIRLKHSIFHSMFAHSLWNSLVFIALYFVL